MSLIFIAFESEYFLIRTTFKTDPAFMGIYKSRNRAIPTLITRFIVRIVQLDRCTKSICVGGTSGPFWTNNESRETQHAFFYCVRSIFTSAGRLGQAAVTKTEVLECF